MLRRFEPCLGRNARVSKWSKEVTNKKRKKQSRLAQSVERGSNKPKANGSSPLSRINNTNSNFYNSRAVKGVRFKLSAL